MKNVTRICLSSFLAACSGQEPAEQSNSSNTSTIRLDRQDDGDYRTCDADGRCTDLPAPGDSRCAVIVIVIDNNSGQTCQSCTLDDGTTIDQGCSGAVIQCQVIEIPDPDCVVCAYVNGAVTHNTCVVPPSPECVADSDCVDRAGGRGRCVNGECEFADDPGCTSDADCRADAYCEYNVCPAAPCYVEDRDGDGQYGDDEWYCPPCYGQCVPHQADGCAAVRCEAGYHCEEYCTRVACPETDPNCNTCSAQCVPDSNHTGCSSDRECAQGESCVIACTEMACADNNPNCNSCHGSCWPSEPDPCATVLCGPGEICTLEEVVCVTQPCPPQPVCVPIHECLSDADCGPGQACVVDQADCGFGTQPTPPPDGSAGLIAPACWGTCRPADPVDPCAAILCAEGYACRPVDVACSSLDCAQAECVPVGPFDCDDSQLLCDMATPQCRAGYRPAVDGFCYTGDCVPAELCADTRPQECVISGCSNEICSDQPMFSPCIWREEYACYANATCERQNGGPCGWTQTEELRMCLAGTR